MNAAVLDTVIDTPLDTVVIAGVPEQSAPLGFVALTQKRLAGTRLSVSNQQRRDDGHSFGAEIPPSEVKCGTSKMSPMRAGVWAPSRLAAATWSGGRAHTASTPGR